MEDFEIIQIDCHFKKKSDQNLFLAMNKVDRMEKNGKF